MKQITKEKAIELSESGFWKSMSKEQIAKFQMTQARLCVPFSVFHEAIEHTLKRPIFTHEFGLNREGIMSELFYNGPAPSFEEVLDMLPKDKVVIVTEGE